MTDLEALWARHDAEWREPAQVLAQWTDAGAADPALLRMRVQGAFWEVLAAAEVTLLVTREYEHLVMALHAGARPSVTFLRLPHPSGVTVDPARELVHLASTRNPNVVYDLAPAANEGRLLVPIRARFYPGALYLHDLAMVGGRLHGNAVGRNAVVRLPDAGPAEPVWWPRSIERDGDPDFSRNYLQVNSIAAACTLRGSFFTASAGAPSGRRPGQRNFPVDGRGVVFAGGSREVVVRGLTRPHSARLHAGEVWVDNSGYGELVLVRDGAFEPVARLPGWTRGLCFVDGTALVGVSRVIPRFRRYAPGLDVARSECGVYAVDTASGETVGSVVWPRGNQIFAVQAVDATVSGGLPFVAGRRQPARARRLFYGFQAGPKRKEREAR